METGNHHLFLIVKTNAQKTWIVLLGKRKKHFPFIGTRFENATFYDVREEKSYHQTEECLDSLQFDLNHSWKVSGEKPFPFRFKLEAFPLEQRRGFLKKWIPFSSRWIPGVIFDYHLLSSQKNVGSIRGERIESMDGFSEKGTYTLLPGKMWEIPFDYLLLLEPHSQSGLLRWRVPRIPFLGDQWGWGKNRSIPDFENLIVLATYDIPLKNWTLHREIIRGQGVQQEIWYGLREHFTPST